MVILDFLFNLQIVQPIHGQKVTHLRRLLSEIVIIEGRIHIMMTCRINVEETKILVVKKAYSRVSVSQSNCSAEETV